MKYSNYSRTVGTYTTYIYNYTYITFFRTKAAADEMKSFKEKAQFYKIFYSYRIYVTIRKIAIFLNLFGKIY